MGIPVRNPQTARVRQPVGEGDLGRASLALAQAAGARRAQLPAAPRSSGGASLPQPWGRFCFSGRAHVSPGARRGSALEQTRTCVHCSPPQPRLPVLKLTHTPLRDPPVKPERPRDWLWSFELSSLAGWGLGLGVSTKPGDVAVLNPGDGDYLPHALPRPSESKSADESNFKITRCVVKARCWRTAVVVSKTSLKTKISV